MTGSTSSNSSNNDIYAVSTRFNFKGRHVTLIIDTLLFSGQDRSSDKCRTTSQQRADANIVWYNWKN